MSDTTNKETNVGFCGIDYRELLLHFFVMISVKGLQNLYLLLLSFCLAQSIILLRSQQLNFLTLSFTLLKISNTILSFKFKLTRIVLETSNFLTKKQFIK